MSQAMTHAPAGQAIRGSQAKRWMKFNRQQLYRYYPRFRDWRFWAVQGLVILIAGAHSIVEAKTLLHDLGVPSFIPTALFLVPVIYAGLTFGFIGAVATALWATVLTIPNWVLWHQSLEKLGCISQLLVVNVVAYFVGRQVDRERGTRQQAEAAVTALKASEAKYHGLFESSPIAILVIDPTGTILAANPAASTLFGRDKATLEKIHLTNLFGMAGVQKLIAASRNSERPDYLTLKLKDGSALYIEPIIAEAGNNQGNLAIQVLLRDATEEHHRRAGLKAYAAHVIRTHEEERKRIARELHDETIQALVLLCRRLDSLEAEDKSFPPSLAVTLREARKMAEEVVGGLRGFVKSLRPPILDDLGMTASIRRLLADFAERTKTEGKLKVVGEDRRLPPDTELAMFRIAQEALWNAERHAQATRADVTITFTEYEVGLEVVDNGIGFSVPSDRSDFDTSGHLGLLSMKERAELLGGKLEIRSRSGEGTRVSVFIPGSR